ncbi:cyclase family protein [Paenibacillus sinopodophylli]|uniref:cyclase family protein n=1 Tax=Paenibacillus sinopodophylli TaxID=1837342 RepID=UPI00110D16F7|nr:cyclase family protein [Paenibacillus sinopodophylli]
MIIDLTYAIMAEMPVYPGDEETSLTHTQQFGRDGYNNHQLSINMHAGTHIDGPMHLLDLNEYISDLPIATFVGEGILLDVSGVDHVEYKTEYEAIIQEGHIVVVYTGFGKHYGEEAYFTDYPVLSPAFVELLIRKKIKMLGLDTPSPDKFPYASHKRLFSNQIPIIENLAHVDHLVDVKAFEIIALPLRIQADSSPARVIAIVR